MLLIEIAIDCLDEGHRRLIGVPNDEHIVLIHRRVDEVGRMIVVVVDVQVQVDGTAEGEVRVMHIVTGDDARRVVLHGLVVEGDRGGGEHGRG